MMTVSVRTVNQSYESRERTGSAVRQAASKKVCARTLLKIGGKVNRRTGPR